MRVVSSDLMKVLMGAEFDAFTDFCLSPGGAKVKWQFEQTDTFDLDDPLVIAKVNAMAGILSAATITRILSYDPAAATLPPPPTPASYARSFRVPIPAGETSPLIWVTGFVTADIEAVVSDSYIILSTNGECVAPGTEVM